MAKVKRNVANELRYGCSVTSIVKSAVENDDLTKWDVTKVIACCVWFKFLAGIRWLWNVVCGLWFNCLGPLLLVVLAIILGLIVNILGGALVIIVGTLWVITSLIWMPILISKSPEKAAEAVTDNDYESIDEPEDLIGKPVGNLVQFFSKVLAWMWAPIIDRLSMNRRSYFIKASDKALFSYPVDVQIEYYDQTVEKREAAQQMSKAALDALWNRGKLVDREAILSCFEISLDEAVTLFNGDEKEFNLLRRYCNTENKKVNAEIIDFFISVLTSETASADHKERAFKLLKICAERGALEVEAQLQLVKQLASLISEQAEEVLKLYWKKNTFSTAVMEKLIQLSTANGDVSRPFNLLKKAVDRDGIKTSLAELFFDRCDSDQNEEMSRILKERIDREKVSHFEEKTHSKEWEDYLNFIKDLSVEAQSRLQEWQYDAFIKHGFTLDKEAAYYLLVYGIDSYSQDYFKKVLNASASELDETTQKLLMLTEWKREILIKQKGCRLQGWLLRVPLPESTLA
jgi:hypothetical protein